MRKPSRQFHHDASDRLCFELYDAEAVDYPKLVSRIVDHFNLTSTSNFVVGLDQMFENYSDGQCSVGMDWDIWSGFIVTAHSKEAEPLVKAIGVFLSAQ